MTTKNVPLEPTEVMIEAGEIPTREIRLGNGHTVRGLALGASAASIYRAMLAASPPSGGEVAAWQYRYQISGTDIWSDWNQSSSESACKRMVEVHIANGIGAESRPLYTSPRVVNVDAIAKALAESQGWAKWDTAQNCCDTLGGNEPEEEREHYRNTVKFVVAALEAK